MLNVAVELQCRTLHSGEFVVTVLYCVIDGGDCIVYTVIYLVMDSKTCIVYKVSMKR